MGRESIHDKLGRVRPPRVHITYQVHTGGATEKKELPFIIGVMGDFAGKQDLEQRVDEPLATIEPLQNHVPRIPLIAAHTGVRHDSGVVHKSPRDRWLAGDAEVRGAYQQIAQLARLGQLPGAQRN